MRSYLNSWILMSLVLTPCALFAKSTNPVSWSVTPSTGFSATAVGSQKTVKYTLTNHLPFAVVFNDSQNVTGGNFSVRDKCDGTSVAAGGTCDIYVSYSPAGIETSSYQLVYGYHKNRIPTTKFTVTSTSAGSILTGTMVGIPSSIEKNDTPDFSITYENASDNTLTSCTNGGTSVSLSGAASSTASISNLTDNCTGNSILAGNSCTVTGKIIGTSTVGALTVTGNLSCTASSGTVTSNPSAETSVLSTTGCTVHGYVSLPLPSSTYKYADNIVQFTFENECGTAQSISTTVTPSDAYSKVVISPSTTLTTCGSTLEANSDCTVTANVRALDVGDLAVTGNVTYGTSGKSSAVTHTSVSMPTYANHKVTFINQCNQPIWIGIVNAGGSKVDPIAPGTPNDYLLSAQIPTARPSTKTVTFPNEYLGGFWGRTGCTTGSAFTCTTGQCPTSGPTSGTCSGASPLAPYTGVEMNFFTAAQSDGSYDGNYDITMIGGVNIPIMMKGFGPGKTITSGYNNTPFACNSAGSPVQDYSVTGLGSCPWSFTVPGLTTYRMPTKAFYFVSNDATPTSYNLDSSDNCGCASDKLCGLALGTSGSDKNKYIPACGSFLGYLTINTLCTSVFNLSHVSGASDPQTYYHCSNTLNTQFNTTRYLSTNTVADLYDCTFDTSQPAYLNSCYLDSKNVGYNNKCCGSYEWTNTRLDMYTAMSNPDWANTTSSLVPSPFNSVNWLESGCPTAYTYPFGDHFGSFYCKESPDGTHVKMEYEVVYCPAGTSISS